MALSKAFTRLLLGAACAACMSSAANAADAVVEEAVILEPGFTWTGLYIGANVGYSWADLNHQLEADSILGPFSDDFDAEDDGIIGGAQIGYNWQVDNFVFGVEADVQAADIEGSATNTYLFPFVAIVDVTARTKLDWFGTARVRAGFVPAERLMVYATGGFAFGETTSTASYVGDSIGGPFGDQATEKTTRTGWAAGAGAEYAFADHWSLKAEYLYTDLGDEDFLNLAEPLLFEADLSSEVKFHTVRLGLNYKF